MKTNLLKVLVVACVSVVVVNYLFHPAPKQSGAGITPKASAPIDDFDFSAFAVAYAMPQSAGSTQPQRPIGMAELGRGWEPMFIVITNSFHGPAPVRRLLEVNSEVDRLAPAAPKLGAPLSPPGALIDFNHQPAMDFTR